MSRLAVLAAALAGCGRLGFDTGPDAHRAAFTYRQRIDLRSTKLAAPVGPIPIFVHVGSSDPARAPTLADLRFFAEDGATPLPFELGDYIKSSPFLDAWVLVPMLNGPTHDDAIYAYWGDPAAPGEAAPHDVWGDAFIGVWHLADGTDSTANRLNGTFTGTAIVDGVAGSARDTSDNGFLEVPYAAALDAIGEGNRGAWSAWVRVASFPAGPTTAVGRQADDSALNDFRFGVNPNGGVEGEVAVDPALDAIYAEAAAGSVEVQAWAQLGLVLDGATMRLVIDGTLRAPVAVTGSVHRSTTRLVFGADCNACPGAPNGDFIDGVIDEVRILRAPPPEVWFTAEYLDLTGALTVVQDPEPL